MVELEGSQDLPALTIYESLAGLRYEVTRTLMATLFPESSCR